MPSNSRRSRRATSRRNRHGGSLQLPNWIMYYIREAVRLQQVAHTLDKGRHTFLIAGSTAILFYAETLYRMVQNDEKKVMHILKVLESIQPPRDLDFKYAGHSQAIFEESIQRRNEQSGSGLLGISGLRLQTLFDTNIATCPEFVDFDVFRSCTPLGPDVVFRLREGERNVFESVDFTELPARRRVSSLNGTVEILYAGAQVLGFEELQQFYARYERGTNSQKRRVLEALLAIRAL